MDDNLEKILEAPVNEDSVVFNVEGLNFDIPGVKTEEPAQDPPKEKEEEVSTEQPKQEPDPVKTNTGISSIVKENIEKGKWQDLEIEDAEGNVVKVSDMDHIDNDMFNLIYQEQEKIKQEEVEKNYLSVQGLTDVQKALIDLVKVGGDHVAETLNSNPDALQPIFHNEDLQTEGSQIRVFVQDYMMKGVSQQDAENLAKLKIDSGDLYGEAHEIKQRHHEKHLKDIEAVKAEIIQQQNQALEQEKNFKKSLKEQYLNAGYNPKTVDTLVEAGTKKVDHRFAIDDLYYQMMTEPKTAYKLIEFLVDPESFENKIKKKTTTENALETLGTIRRVNLPKKTTTSSKTEVNTEAPVFHFKNK